MVDDGGRLGRVGFRMDQSGTTYHQGLAEEARYGGGAHSLRVALAVHTGTQYGEYSRYWIAKVGVLVVEVHLPVRQS